MTEQWSNVPQTMKAARRWVIWGSPHEGDAGRKIPYQLDGRTRAKPNDSSTWGTFDDAVRAAGRHGFSGVSFALGGGFSGVDFDGCTDDCGRAYKAIDQYIGLIGSYTEYSPSGTGFHVITRARWPIEKDSFRIDFGRHFGIECYRERRFFAVTGRVYDIYSDITANHDGFSSFLVAIQLIGKAQNHHKEKRFNPPPRTTYQRREGGFKPPDDDKELLRLISNSRKGAEFDRLFYGGYEGDESRADLALMNILAFFTNGDAARMERLFRQSELYARPDFGKHGRDYIARTINKALSY